MLKSVIFLLLLALLPVDASGQGRVLNILYTGAINGELEPCGCSPKTESGGLARLSGYISANREKMSPYLLIDAGNSMGEDTPQGRLKAEALLESFDIMGYDAAAILKRTALLPEDFRASLIEKHRVPALSESAGTVTTERGSIRINISADPEGYRDGVLNILLTDRPVSEAMSVKGWEVIITSSGEILDEPQKADGKVIVSGYPKGRRLGILTLGFDGGGKVTAVSHRWQSLDKGMKEDENVRKVLDEYDEKVAGLVRDEERKASSESPYRGLSVCAECHQPFLDTWRDTRHAGAFNSLEKAGKSKDPECVRCHTTGYSREGFYSMAATPGLANVQCEACHGPGREHAMDPYRPMRPVGEPVCLECHTKSNSPDFDFKLYLERIRHR